MRKWVWLLWLVLFLSTWNSLESQVNRTYRMGLSSQPPDVGDTPTRFIHDYIATHADLFVQHDDNDQLPWTDFLDGASVSAATAESFRLRRAERDTYPTSFKYYVGLSLLSPVRNGPRGGPGVPDSPLFSNPVVRAALSRYAAYTVDQLRPDYLALGIELNSYATFNATDFPYLMSLYADIYWQLKVLYPSMMIFPTFTLDLLNGLSQWDLVRALDPALDIVAFSYYGNGPVSDLPVDYISKVRNYSQKPVGMAEMGFSSQPVTLSDGTVLRGSETEQMQFMNRMIMESDMLSMVFVNWFFPADIYHWLYAVSDYLPAATMDKLRRFTFDGQISWPNPNQKPASSVWNGAFARPIQ